MVIQILYEGTDITEVTNITRCVCRDVSHGRADSLELQFDHAAIWHLWAPKEDDKIIVNSDGYTTGTMYLNAIMPEGDGFRILATALPSAARRKAWDTYQNMTLENIVGRCAAEAGNHVAPRKIQQLPPYPLAAALKAPTLAFQQSCS